MFSIVLLLSPSIFATFDTVHCHRLFSLPLTFPNALRTVVTLDTSISRCFLSGSRHSPTNSRDILLFSSQRLSLNYFRRIIFFFSALNNFHRVSFLFLIIGKVVKTITQKVPFHESFYPFLGKLINIFFKSP